MKTYQTIHLIARHVCKKVFAICLFLLGGVANAWASESRDTINGLVYTLDENTMTAQLTSAADKNITNANIVEKIVNDKGTFRVYRHDNRRIWDMREPMSDYPYHSIKHNKDGKWRIKQQHRLGLRAPIRKPDRTS